MRPCPVAALPRETPPGLIGRGFAEKDLAGLVELEAHNAGMQIAPENVKVSDGLE